MDAGKDLFLDLVRPGYAAPIGTACLCFVGPQEGQFTRIGAGDIATNDLAVDAKPVVAQGGHTGEPGVPQPME